MTQILITIPEEQVEVIGQMLSDAGAEYEVLAKQDQDEDDVPEWHKAILRERVANSKPEDYIPWEVVKAGFASR